MPKWVLVPAFFLLLSARAAAEGPFLAVTIDAATEKLHGRFPFDRALTARVMTNLWAAGAKGIIPKFFYDLPSKETSDAGLAAAIAAGPTALQACVRQDEPDSNPLPERFAWKPRLRGKPLSGESGWIPRPGFAKAARSVGFVDFRAANAAPMIEQYRGKMVKSLCLCALEMAAGAEASVSETNRLLLGDKGFPLNNKGELEIEFPREDRIESSPFHSVLAAPAEDLKARFAGKIVIITYDGESSPKLSTPSGELNVHRVFLRQLDSAYKALSPN